MNVKTPSPPPVGRVYGYRAHGFSVQGPPASLTCGMMVILKRRLCRPILAMFTPSMMISPSADSLIRNKPRVRDDFPAPVRPTIPTCNTERGCGEAGMLQTQSSPSRCLGQSCEVIWLIQDPPSGATLNKKLKRTALCCAGFQRLKTFYKPVKMPKGTGYRQRDV